MNDSLGIHSVSIHFSSLTKDVMFQDKVKCGVKIKPFDNVLKSASR
jgi:hypothetical protein